MKILLIVLFPVLLRSQSEFSHVEFTVGYNHIIADESYIHLPNRSVIRAKLAYTTSNVRLLSWSNKQYEFYVGYVDNELCFIQESKRTKHMICCWLIDGYKLTQYK